MKAVLLFALFCFAAVAVVNASSHGEAPGVLENPLADATDLYAFVSYETGRSNYVTILANYNPLQDPIAGPNYFPLSNDYYYEILIDQNGDGKEEILYTFDVTSELEDNGGIKVPVYNTGKKTSVPLKVVGQLAAGQSTSGKLNWIDSYKLSVTKGGKTKSVKAAGTSNSVFTIPFDNAGEKTIPNYQAYADQYIYTISIPGCDATGRVFVGQRAESFFIPLGQTFDLVNYQNNQLPILQPQGALLNSRANNDIAGKNVDVFALEVPIQCLKGKSDVIGIWTRARSKNSGKQNNRLGNALVNELIIGLEDKDLWNKLTPADDEEFVDYFNYPAFPELLNILFSGPAGVARISPTNFPRKDLNIALQQGLEGLNKLTKDSKTYADMLRLNTAIAPAAVLNQQPLGALAGDTAGYPNGRRPGDDVVDITLRVAMGVLCHSDFSTQLGCSAADAPTGTFLFGDGAYRDATDFASTFPYLLTPLPGATISP
eukprot:TRINITY_DN94_c0_g1_i2.p1 TRINITY_DN94_c0_g1~~TRINITY_DN94_c0_g1_i2.p1  ORF type:complete len:505 (+),score=145.68 TRINITY_DN94_c0_g1_i2:56-1516(+)